MAKRMIFGCYAAAAGCIAGSNLTNYQPTNEFIGTYWNLLKHNNNDYSDDTGKTLCIVFFTCAPALVPIFTITLPILAGMEHFINKD
jgi:hypothetical protein